MAKRREKAMRGMTDVGAAVVKKAHSEADGMQKLANKDHIKLAPWDWQDYSEQVKKADYARDESVIKQYFLLDRVLQDGVFFAANKLYGIAFNQRHDLPVYQPDLHVFEGF